MFYGQMRIVIPASGRALHPQGDEPGQGARIIPKDLRDKSNQKWSYSEKDDAIVNPKPKLVFDAAGGALDDCDRIIMWGYHRADNQRSILVFE